MYLAASSLSCSTWDLCCIVGHCCGAWALWLWPGSSVVVAGGLS